MNKDHRHGEKPIAYYNLASGMARHNLHVIGIIVLGIVVLFGTLVLLASAMHA